MHNWLIVYETHSICPGLPWTGIMHIFTIDISRPLDIKNWGVCMHGKPLQSCPTLCNPLNCSPPGSSVHGILQARILEWVAMPSSSDLPDGGTCSLRWSCCLLAKLPRPCLKRSEKCAAALKNSLAISYKTKNTLIT